MTTSAHLAFVVPALLAVAGCGASVEVDHWSAAAIDIDGARDVVVTDAFGRGDSVDAIAAVAVERLRYEPWFSSVADLSRHDRLETDGVDAWLRHGEMERGTLYLRFDVLEDLAVIGSAERVVENADGSVDIFVDEVVSAHTLLSVTLADDRGVILDELEYEGVVEVAGPVDEAVIGAAMQSAATAAVAAAIGEIAPRHQLVSVPLDERDEDVMSLVRPAIDASSAKQQAVADRLANVAGPSALFSRAALTEAAGDLVGAVELYRAAARMAGAFDGAADIKNGAEARLQDARLLGLVR